MPQPTQRSVHINAALTQISIATIQAATNFVAPRFFPIVPVDKKTDKYYIFDKLAWFQDVAKRRGDNEESAGSGFTLSDDNYSCDVFALHKDLGDQTLANQDAVLNLERSAARYVANALMIRKEVQFVSDFLTTGVWDTDKTVDRTWDDVLSDPIEDIGAGCEQVLSVTGHLPNKLLLSYPVFRQLRRHPDIADLLKYTGDARNITAQMLADIFELDEVLVTRAVYSTSEEGNASPTYSFVAGKHALLAHVAANPAPEVPSAGYQFAWTGVSGSLGETVGTDSFFIRKTKTQRVESEMAWDNKVTGSDLGYFFSSVVS